MRNRLVARRCGRYNLGVVKWPACLLIAYAVSMTAASAAEIPTPLLTPTGYRDYCAGAPKRMQCQRGGTPGQLWRPLDLPDVSPGSPCPVSAARKISSQFAPVLGSGPVYVGTYSPGPHNVVPVPYPAPEGSPAFGTGWTVTKIPLVMPKSLRQPIIARGRRIDGDAPLGFSGPAGRRPYAAIQYPPGGNMIDLGRHKAVGVLAWASEPGCYSLQIDGRSFSRVVTFRIEFVSPG